ncbi:hypothetical protein [Altibacter sp.]|uniref:hypothetical protein n=1 Tax=Altibacter sp. TaxID=2024823 RepID=UPI000C916CBE|nr:hypothetical protein [Altibacter sp.]MAP54389.1 hypothetical protein [Altibacter sp.]
MTLPSIDDKRIKVLYYLFLATLIIFLFGDILRKLALNSHDDFVRYTAISKGLVLACYGGVLAYFFRIYRKEQRSRYLLYAISILIFSFLLSQAVINDTSEYLYRIRENLVYLSRFLFLPITFLIFSPLLKSEDKVNKLFRFFEILFFINCGLMVLGAIFDVHVFRTYISFKRYGYMGIYNSNNQASFYFMFMIVVYYYKTFFLTYKPYKLIIAVACSLLLGTKKMYFFFPLLLAFDFFYFKRYVQKWFWVGLAGIIIIGIAFYKAIGRFITEKFKVLVDIYHEQGLITSITSTRNIELANTISEVIVPKWSFLNYLVGGSEFYNHRPEMEFFDIYFFFGIVGICIFAWLLKDVMRFLNAGIFLIGMLIIYLIAGFFASGFIISANQPIIFLLTFAFIGFLKENASKVTRETSE